MKKYISQHKGQFKLLVSSAVLVTLYFLIMVFLNHALSFELIVGILKPLAVFSIGTFLLSAFFLFFSEQIFISWLKRIFWWYTLIIILLTANTPIFSSHILSFDRSYVVFLCMIPLAVATIVYALYTHIRLKRGALK